MADSYQLFNEIRENASLEDGVISNVKALGLPEGCRALKILWMYPDVLNVFGSRGDLMALMRVGCAMGVPVEIKRVNSLSDDIDFDKADIIYYPAGDLSCMESIMKRNEVMAGKFREYVGSGRMIIAVSSSGVLLAEEFIKQDGSVVKGLGLLGMKMKERKKVHGDDLWIKMENGTELIGNQIQLVDVILEDNQKPLGEVVYGRGNDGSGAEGAVTDGVIYTACLGPVMVRNPWFAAEILAKAALKAGLAEDEDSYKLPEEEMTQERLSFEDAARFIKDKM